ncbi:MAG: hypothetical protein GY953_13865 [bacterium]|nr:hypothetical protein [bacterium]
MSHTRRQVLQTALAGAGLTAFPVRGMAVPEQIKAFCIDFNWLFDQQEGWPNRFAKPGHWAAASPAEHVAWYEGLGANVIQTFAVSCNGHAWYKNGFVPPQPGLRHDFLTEVVKLGHRKGMMVMAYFCAGANSKWAQDHPDLSYGMPSTLHIPYTDEYLDYLSRSIEDAVRKTGIDGFMIDWVWNPKPELRQQGWIDSEKKLYEQLTGNAFPRKGAPAKEQTLKYERAAIARCWKTVHSAAKDTNPDSVIWLSCNNITEPTVAGSAMLREVDWLMNESYREDYLEAGRDMRGSKTRLLQCLVGWAEHNARGFLSEANNERIDLYGFARPRDTSLPLPISEYLGKPIQAFSGKDRDDANDRNIATLARFYNGMEMDAEVK